MVWFILAHFFRILVAFRSIRRLSDLEKELERLVLRHQLAIMKRKSNKPVKPNQIGKMTLAILTATYNKLPNDLLTNITISFEYSNLKPFLNGIENWFEGKGPLYTKAKVADHV